MFRTGATVMPAARVSAERRRAASCAANQAPTTSSSQRAVLHARGVGGEARVGLHVGPADEVEDAQRHGLGRGRQRHVLAVAAAIDVARRGGVRGAARRAP